MAGAVVRNRIANSTIDQIIKNRQALREAINEEMTEVVKGWGVWLETIEITDVKILSSNLFKDMQTQFREQQKKTATLQKMEVDNQIKEEKLNHELSAFKRSEDQRKEKTFLEQKNTLHRAQAELDAFAKDAEVKKLEYDRQISQKIFNARKTAEYRKLEIQLEIEKIKNEVENQILEEKASREVK